jgi:hypothetical protein
MYGYPPLRLYNNRCWQNNKTLLGQPRFVLIGQWMIENCVALILVLIFRRCQTRIAYRLVFGA